MGLSLVTATTPNYNHESLSSSTLVSIRIWGSRFLDLHGYFYFILKCRVQSFHWILMYYYSYHGLSIITSARKTTKVWGSKL
jgi:hypothetical protein